MRVLLAPIAARPVPGPTTRHGDYHSDRESNFLWVPHASTCTASPKQWRPYP